MSLVGASRRGLHAAKVETMPRMVVDPETGKLVYPGRMVADKPAPKKSAKTTRQTPVTHVTTKVAKPGAHGVTTSHDTRGVGVYQKTFKTPKGETTWTIEKVTNARVYDPASGAFTSERIPGITIEIVKGDVRETRATGKQKRYRLDKHGNLTYGKVPVTVLEAARLVQLGAIK